MAFAAGCAVGFAAGCEDPLIPCLELPPMTVPPDPPGECVTHCDCSSEYCENSTARVDPGELTSAMYGEMGGDWSGCYDGYDRDGNPVARMHLRLEQLYHTRCGCIAYFQGWYAGTVEVLREFDDRVPPEGLTYTDLLPFEAQITFSFDWPEHSDFEMSCWWCGRHGDCLNAGLEEGPFPADLVGRLRVGDAENGVWFLRRDATE